MRSLFTFVLALLLSAAVARGEDFPIKLNRPEKVGNKVKMTGEASETNSMTISIAGQAQPPQASTAAYKIEAEVEVLEVGKAGGPTKLQITVASLTQQVGSEDKALAKKGDVIIARVDGKNMVFESKEGVKVSPAAVKGLNMLIQLEREDTPDVDAIFGTKEKKKVGDTWPMDADAAVKSLATHGLKLDKEKVKGQGKLVSEKTESGVPCLEVAIEMTASAIPIPEGKLPPGATVKSSSLVMNGSALLPKDLARGELKNQMQMVTKMQMAATIPNFGEAVSDVMNSRTKTVTMTPIK